MRIDPEEFSYSLLGRYGKQASHFDALINEISDYDANALTTECFSKFSININNSENSLFLNQIYDLFNYFRLYHEGGVFKLFKGRQAEWGGPKIRITQTDVPSWNPSKLTEPLTVYRGMSKVEYNSGNFGQSWTVLEEVACRFATETYSDIESGIVVKINVRLASVIYFDDKNCEGEVILGHGSVSKKDVLEIGNGVL